MKKKISMAHRPFIALLNRNRVLTPALCQSLEAMLPEVERNHMEKLDQHHVRSRYLAGRGVLRLLISFLSMAPVPEKLFHAEDSGPPLGVKCSDGKELSISVSHSGRYSLFGFSKTGRIGVDIEAIRPVRHMNDAAEYAFSPEEAAWLRGVPRNAAASSFIRLWTRKEAVVKFFRGSVAYDMDRFSVPLAAKKGLFSDGISIKTAPI